MFTYSFLLFPNCTQIFKLLIALVVGSRRIDKVLDYASQLITNTRELFPKIVLLLTAGRRASGRPLELAVKPLQEHGAKIYVVTIGDRPDVNELLPIVKDERFVINISSFDNLPGRALQVAQTLGNQSGERVIAFSS